MKKLVLLVITISSLLITGCFFQQKTYSYKDTRFLMDTIVEITVYGDDEAKLSGASDGGFTAFKGIADVTDNYESRQEKDLFALNLQAGKGPFVVDKKLFTLLSATKKLPYEKIDLTLGPVISLWHEHSKNTTVPTKAEVAAALVKCGHNSYTLDKSTGSVTLPAGTAMDLGAVAKGYAVDRAYDALKKDPAVKSALINAGGNIKILGKKQDGKPWRIGIQDPRHTDKMIGTLEIAPGMSLATSGDYQRFYEVDGVRYHHIIDPDTGYPARNAISTTAVHASAFLADYYSTLLFILPTKEAEAIVEKTDGLEAIIINPHGKIYVSPGLKNIFKAEQ